MASLAYTLAEKFLSGNLNSNNANWYFYLLKNWDTIVGGLKTRIRLDSVKGSILVIGVYQVHWMQELFLLSRVLLDNINKNLNGYKISSLQFKLVTDKPIKKKPDYLNKSLDANISKPVMLTQTHKLALKKLNDEKLEQALVSFLKRCQEK